MANAKSADLLRWRERMQMSQPEMARYLDVSLHSYRKWEQGQHAYPQAVQSLIDLLQELEGTLINGNRIVKMRQTRARQNPSYNP